MSQRQVYLVTLPGKAFYCEVQTIAGQPRWAFTSTERMRYIGPPWIQPLEPEEVHALVADWWATKKALAQDM